MVFAKKSHWNNARRSSKAVVKTRFTKNQALSFQMFLKDGLSKKNHIGITPGEGGQQDLRMENTSRDTSEEPQEPQLK